jgi:hypothetical protein
MESLPESICRVSHSTKRTRHIVHRQSLFCRVLSLGHLAQTLPSARKYSAKKSRRHGAGVTETTTLPSVPGDTRQRSYLCRVTPNTLGKKVTFAECLPSSTRQRICQRVPMSGSLPSARATTLGKEPIPVPSSSFFAECYGLAEFFAEVYVIRVVGDVGRRPALMGHSIGREDGARPATM